MAKTKKRSAKASSNKTKLLIAAGVVVLGIIAYSLYITFSTGAQDKGIVTCIDENTCFFTAHWHAYTPIMICGQETRLPIETGSLQKAHTHEEKNLVHWHDRLPYDNTNKKIMNATPLFLGSFFDEIKIPFDNDKIMDKKNGDQCPDGKPGTLKMFVNGKPNTEFRDYLWKNYDVIVLVFDNRSLAEVETELASKPIAFPTLGRG